MCVAQNSAGTIGATGINNSERLEVIFPEKENILYAAANPEGGERGQWAEI